MPIKEPPQGEKSKDPEVKIIPSEKLPEPVKVEIDASTGKEIQPEKPSISPDDFKKLQGRMEYHARQNEMLQKRLEETLNRLSQYQPIQSPAPQAEKPKSDDEFGPDLDAIAQQDWRKGVSIIAEKRAEKIAEAKIKAALEEREKILRDNQERMLLSERQRQGINWVYEQSPSLKDETSDEYKEYFSMFSQMSLQNPDLAQNPLGPEMVWHRWQHSKRSQSPSDKQEEDRLKRVAAGAIPTARQSQGKKTYQLTQEEIELCNSLKISPARYAATKEANLKEGVSA